jgi:hypothetical protein
MIASPGAARSAASGRGLGPRRASEIEVHPGRHASEVRIAGVAGVDVRKAEEGVPRVEEDRRSPPDADVDPTSGVKAEEVLGFPEVGVGAEAALGDVVVTAATQQKWLDRMVEEEEEKERPGQLALGHPDERGVLDADLLVSVGRRQLHADHPGDAISHVHSSDGNGVGPPPFRDPALEAEGDAGVGKRLSVRGRGKEREEGQPEEREEQ